MKKMRGGRGQNLSFSHVEVTKGRLEYIAITVGCRADVNGRQIETCDEIAKLKCKALLLRLSSVSLVVIRLKQIMM